MSLGCISFVQIFLKIFFESVFKAYIFSHEWPKLPESMQ